MLVICHAKEGGGTGGRSPSLLRASRASPAGAAGLLGRSDVCDKSTTFKTKKNLVFSTSRPNINTGPRGSWACGSAVPGRRFPLPPGTGREESPELPQPPLAAGGCSLAALLHRPFCALLPQEATAVPGFGFEVCFQLLGALSVGLSHL